MREGISIDVSAAERERLVAVVADRDSRQKHVWRARIIVATAEGCGAAEMRRAGVSKPCVWGWQERFMREGAAGLRRDKPRKPGLPPLPPAVIGWVVELGLTEPPGAATHWTGRAMAAASGVSLRSVQRIWAADGLPEEYPLVVRCQRMIPIRWRNRTTNLLIWADSRDAWEPSVSIGPLASFT
jgi:hypothetical protein